jgi:hypothetical protein
MFKINNLFYILILSLFAIPFCQLIFWSSLFYVNWKTSIATIILIEFIPIKQRNNKTISWDFIHFLIHKTIIKNQIHYNISEKFQTLYKNNKPAIVACGPHGIMPMTTFVIFDNYSNSIIHTIKFTFFNPLTRILAIFYGNISIISKSNIIDTLNNNKLAVIYPGGVSEMLNRNEFVSGLYPKHKGFIRIAKEKNVPIVPVYISNEIKAWTDAFPNFTKWTYNVFGLPIISPVYLGRQNIIVTIGDPIYIEDFESIDDVFKHYYKIMNEFYITHN